MRYLIAVLAITCLASTSDAGCRGKRIRNRPVVKATAAVVAAPVQAVRTIVCNGKTCTVVK